MLGHKLIQVLSKDFETATTIRSEKSWFVSLGFQNQTKIYEQIILKILKGLKMP